MARKSKPTEQDDRFVWHICDWRDLYELAEQNKPGRPTFNGLQFRKSIVSRFDAKSHDYLMKLKRMRVHPDRHVLRSIHDDLVDFAAMYDRPRRGWLVDAGGEPLQMHDLAIELDLYNADHAPDAKTLRIALTGLDDLGLIEQVPYSQWIKDYHPDAKPKRRRRAAQKEPPPGGGDDVKGTAQDGSVFDDLPPGGGDDPGTAQGELSDIVGHCRHPLYNDNESEPKTEQKLNDNESETLTAPMPEQEPATPGRGGVNWEFLERKRTELAERKARESKEGRQVDVAGCGLALPATPPVTPGAVPLSHAPHVPPMSPEVGTGDDSPPAGRPPMSFDRLQELAHLATAPTQLLGDGCGLEFAWIIHQALGLGGPNDPVVGERAKKSRARNLASFQSTYEYCLQWVPASEFDTFLVKVIKRASGMARQPNPAKCWTGTVKKKILPGYSSGRKNTG